MIMIPKLFSEHYLYSWIHTHTTWPQGNIRTLTTLLLYVILIVGQNFYHLYHNLYIVTTSGPLHICNKAFTGWEQRGEVKNLDISNLYFLPNVTLNNVQKQNADTGDIYIIDITIEEIVLN